MALRVPPLRSLQSNRGFALLITLTMLAFIVLMLVGLAAYTRVETSVAGNTQRQAQARENALLALNVAVGQLQKYAGVDTAITATAAGFGGRDGTMHYTGVWPSTYTPPPAPVNPEDPVPVPTPEIPRTWLVSGNEFTKPDVSEGAEPGATVPDPLVKTPAEPGSGLQVLVGARSTATNNTRNARWVEAPLVNLTATGIPGTSATTSTVIGRYAWWVGDQGVKAPVAIPDLAGGADYAPWDSAELRSRIAQQFTHGASASDGTGTVSFDPWGENNAGLLSGDKISTFSQLAFLRGGTGNTAIGMGPLRERFHEWTTQNYAVIADAKRGGLKRDLSLDPSLLGAAFAAWADYQNTGYLESYLPPPPVVEGGEVTPPTETPTEPAVPIYEGPAISPAYEADPLRRRYRITPHFVDTASGASHQVTPILSAFFLSFSVRTETETGSTPLEVHARWRLSLWNPYTSALMPEVQPDNIRVEITGLPTSVQVLRNESSLVEEFANFSLADVFGDRSLQDRPLRLSLPWDSANVPSGAPPEERQSWLPGRVYTWSSDQVDKSQPIPADGYLAKFYPSAPIQLSDTTDVVVHQVSPNAVDAAANCYLNVNGSSQLRVRVLVKRDGDWVQIGNYQSPTFTQSFVTSEAPIGRGDYQFSYVFRLAESIDNLANPSAWLTTPLVDFRRRSPPSEIFAVGENGNSPELYANYTSFEKPDRLLDRGGAGYSYNEDVPIFELPRSPLLSLGALQHLRLVGQRPFMIGNTWGLGAELNGIPTGALFDRFFFSGLVAGVTPKTTARGDLLMPNPLLRPLRKPDFSRVTVDDIRRTHTIPAIPADGDTPEVPAQPSPSGSRSSMFFLQGGAFNLNSTSAAAWASVLRGVRFPLPRAFSYLDVAATTGTATDSARGTISSGDAQFFRFSQSAQETFKAEPGLADPTVTSVANTHLFRQGMRTLSAEQIGALATAIAARIEARHSAADGAGGPFRSVEEFLTPFGGSVDADGNVIPGTSVLEGAIATAGINAGIPEFSSQWLTQADVMTALAPVLFPRSDTFIIRTYGEALNPTTGATEGRAWCEALVQRLPEYFAEPGTYTPDNLADAFEPGPLPDTPDVVPEPTEAQKLNKALGRRFKVVSFRWLTRTDI